MFKLNLIKIFIIINYILKINKFPIYKNNTKKATNKYNNHIPLSPTAEAIFNLKKGYL